MTSFNRTGKQLRLSFAGATRGMLMRYAVILLVVMATVFASGQKAQEDQKKEGVVYFSVVADSFSAMGKWASTSSDPKDQIVVPQEVEIDCFKGGSCIEGTAEYYMGHPHISLRYFEIVRWDKDGILASSSAICLKNTVLINIADQTVSRTDSLKSLEEKKKEACAFFGVKQSQSFVFVLKGTDRWNKEHWPGLLPDK